MHLRRGKNSKQTRIGKHNRTCIIRNSVKGNILYILKQTIELKDAKHIKQANTINDEEETAIFKMTTKKLE